MRNFFEPTTAPSWLRQVLNSIRAALGDTWPVPLRLKDYATADLPAAADFKQGLAWDATVSRVTYSDGSAWKQVMPYAAGAALTRTDDTNVTLTLGGSPATALLAAASLTLGWTGTLSVARGGTNIASYAVGDLIYASASTALSRLADVATGNVLISGGVTTAPAWGKVGLTTHVSGILSGANGGTGNGFFAASGPTSSLKTFTFPDASDTVACLNTVNAFTQRQVITNAVAGQIALSVNGVGGSKFNVDFAGTSLILADTADFRIRNAAGSLIFLRLISTGALFTVPILQSGVQVVNTRRTGWTADTGTAARSANATYAATAEAAYTQATIQALMDAVKNLTQNYKALKDDLITHGLIGA